MADPGGVCGKCEPDNPAARYADTCVRHRVEDGLPCSVCGQSQAETDPRYSCESCLNDLRCTLAGIVLLWRELPAHLRTVSGSGLGGATGGSDGRPLPGGQALALLGPGSAGGSARRLTRSDVAAGLDGREHRHDNRPDDTPSVAWTLLSWCTDLSNLRQDGAYPEGDVA